MAETLDMLTLCCALALPLTAPPVVQTETPTDRCVDASWIVKRVGGDLNATITQDGDLITFGSARIDTPLPEGYPPPTPPGAIDLKKYPSLRRAVVRGNGSPDLGMNLAFWPLFRHIERHDIAMTSPVEMDYATVLFPEFTEHHLTGDADYLNRGSAPSENAWSMAFLYRTPDMGAPGLEGRVEVEDTPPLTVIAIGFQGNYGRALVRRQLSALYDWLADHPEWEVAGPPRALFYNGPEQRPAYRWAEAQLPIRVVPDAARSLDRHVSETSTITP
ncbi:MAG: heme-binding protein [Phycisphaeraceae bacterium]|nr:heme-binding protein [Phycisphaeraceae bacterium]